MEVPGWRLHALTGDHGGYSSVWVNGNWRLTFTFKGEDAVVVDYQDYHQENVFMGRMVNPPHPGSLLREDILPDLGITVTDAASQLGISRVQLSRVLNERAGISPDLALRLEQWISGPRADTWLRMQVDYDLWQTESKGCPKVAPAVRSVR